ncbi:MAG: TonB-dependent receptor [Gammaproteobacteria bacterium]|nr:TonB-dependent receptor [Gammaproteobacteria bacterium]
MIKVISDTPGRAFRMLWAVPLLFAWNAGAAAAAGDGEDIEEVVVTGSYLKRSAANSPSPLSVVTQADIEDLGAVDVAEILQAMPWQSGGQTRTATFGGEGSDGRTSINLRNLGNASTLVLLNGKRNNVAWFNPRGNASVDVNGLIPNIAIERIEIVKDGASALYGSDAIAGVVNFITRDNFQGFDAQIEYSTDEATREGDTYNVQMILGGQWDRGGLVLSAGLLNREEINVDDRYERFGASTISTTGQPGRFTPTQDVLFADGTPVAPSVQSVYTTLSDNAAARILPRGSLGGAVSEASFGNADLSCEASAALEQGGPLGLFGSGGVENQLCPYDFGSFFILQAEEDLRKFHVTGHYDLTDSLEIYTEMGFGNSEWRSRNSLNPNADAATIPVNNLGLIEDARRRDITAQPLVNRSRLLGGTRNTPANRRPLETFSDKNASSSRMVIGGVWDTEILGKAWSFDLSTYRSERDQDHTFVQDTRAQQFQLALAGLGGPNCDAVNGTPGAGNLAFAQTGNFDDGTCFFFNPFGSHEFDANGNPQTDLTLVNPSELYRWLAARTTSATEIEQNVVDFIASGDLVDTGWGPIGLAVGLQRREDTAKVLLDSETNTNNLAFVFGAQDWSGKLTTRAAFAEIGIPIGDTLDVNVAVRFEDFKQLDIDTTDPKLTILWRPLDSLSLRGSIGTSFRVGSLLQLFGSLTTVSNTTDPAFVGSGGAFLSVISDGNALLQPEEVTTTNFGISWVPTGGVLEGLSIDLDYYDYDYDDIITRQSHQRLVNEDGDAINAEIAATGKTVEQIVAEGIVGNRRQVIRNTVGELVRVLPDFVNANSLDADGIDLNASYSFDSMVGALRFGLQAAWVNTYDVVVRTSTGLTKFDGVGSLNAANRVGRPLPEWKVNGSVNWSYGNHSAYLLARFVDGYDFDVAQNALRIETVQTILGENGINTPTVASWTTFDLTYSYRLPSMGFQSAGMVTVGARNLFDRDPPWVNSITGFDPISHDPRGRVWYARYSMSM